jgi:putative peptidoglycan lipid II flippase
MPGRIATADQTMDQTSRPIDRRAHMARSSLVVMGAFVGAKVVGLLRERVIAHQFGASAQYDAYLAAFRTPDVLFTLIAGGALVSAFLPVFSDALAKKDEDTAWTIASAVTNLVFLATVALGGMAAVAAPWLVSHVLAPGFDPAQQALTVQLMRIILLSTVIFSVSGIQMGILNAFQHFLLPAIAPIAYNLGIIAGAVWLTPRYGILGLAYGVVLGALLHLVIKIPGLIRYGFRYLPVLGLKHPGVHLVFALMWPRILALGTVQVVAVVNTRLASGLSAGSLSALNYAWLIAQMPQTVLGTAVATVAFPTMAEYAALDQRQELRRTVDSTLRVLLVLSIPAAAALWALAGPAISVLLRTGAFDADAASATQLALQMFALGLVAQTTLEVVARAFYAQKDTLTPLRVATVAMAINVVLAVMLVGPMAHAGLALANSVAVTVEVVILILYLGRRLPGPADGSLPQLLWRGGLAALAMIASIDAALLLLSRWFPPAAAANPLVSGLAQLALGGLVGVLVYVGGGLWLGIPEVLAGVRWIRSRSRPRPLG